LSSNTILCSVIYPTSFVSTGQQYKNTQNCAKSWKPKSLKDVLVRADISLDLPTMVSVKNVIWDDVWREKTSNDVG
jgi:hypothetical protein